MKKCRTTYKQWYPTKAPPRTGLQLCAGGKWGRYAFNHISGGTPGNLQNIFIKLT